MNWELDLNQKYTDVKVIIQASELTNDINRLTRFIDQLTHTISVKYNHLDVLVDVLSLIYIENIERTTFLYTQSKMYELDRPLYEVEEELARYGMIRINKQTLINPRCIKSVKALLNSRFELLMTSGEKLIVTRHYRNAFKKIFTEGGIYDA